MCNISDTDGLFGYGETSGEIGNSSETLTGKAFYQDLINRANSVPLSHIFKHYGLFLNESNQKITCPFKSHKGGRESSASFKYYPETNSYCCFGCKLGSRGCDFVAAMDGIIKSKAAAKILLLFNHDADENVSLNKEDFSERLLIMLDFSNSIREFRQSFYDEKAYIYAEYICSVYDNLNIKYESLSNEALKCIVDELKEKIGSYKQ
jgi:hypothetical protein